MSLLIASSAPFDLQALGAILFGICLPIVGVIAVGWILDRCFRIDLVTLVKLNLYVFVPAFLFVRVVSSSVDSALAVKVVAFTLVMIAAMALLSFAAAKVLRLPGKSRKAMQLSTMFYNSGNYGIPLTTLAFPVLGPVLQAFVLMTMNISTFTIGLWLASSQNEDSEEKGKRWKQLLPALRQPSIYGILTALTVRALHLEGAVQDLTPVWKPLTYLADGLVGIALLTLGVQLSKTKPPPIRGQLGFALGIRLLGGPLVAAFLVRLFGFEGEVAQILILGTTVPTAVNTALLAHEFGADQRFAAGAVFYSTILSVFTVTVILFLLQAFA